MIEVQDLVKRYEPAGVEALRGVTFAVEEGEVFGLLGRNGAGKSTTVRILTTLLKPTSGRASVAGHDVVTSPDAVRQVMGAALQDASLDDLMTGREHLNLAARLAGMGKRVSAQRAAELLELFGLVAAADRLATGYSGGMRRRLDVAMAMVRRPPVLFLDEPTTGLDPQGRRALWALIADLRRDGCTVFLTTQYLAEADELSTRVAVVHDGRIAATGTPDELKVSLGTTTVRVRLAPGAPPPRFRGDLADHTRVDDATSGTWLVFAVSGGEASVPGLVARLQSSGAAIERLRIQPPTLEEVFVKLTGTEIESSAGAGGASGPSVTAVRRGMGRSRAAS